MRLKGGQGSKGQVAVPKRMFSEKIQRGGVIFNIKIYIAFWTFIQGFKRGFAEKLQYKLPKMRGGQRPFGIFPKIHPFWYRHPSLSNAGALVVVTV